MRTRPNRVHRRIADITADIDPAERHDGLGDGLAAAHNVARESVDALREIGPPEPLASRHDISRFSSGVPTLGAWLQGKARLNEARGGARTYVACDGDRVAGFYSLAASAVQRSRVSSRVGRNMPDPVPVNPAGAARRRRGLARPSPRLRPSGRRRPPHPLRSRGRRRPRRRRAGHRREGKCLPRRAPANPRAAFSLQRLRRPAPRREQGRSRPPACGSGRCRSCSASSSAYPWTRRTPSRS